MIQLLVRALLQLGGSVAVVRVMCCMVASVFLQQLLLLPCGVQTSPSWPVIQNEELLVIKVHLRARAHVYVWVYVCMRVTDCVCGLFVHVSVVT